MRKSVRLLLIVFLAALAVPVFSDPEIVHVPTASQVNRGVITNNKIVITADGGVSAGPGAFPIEFKMAITERKTYGMTGKDGLTPVTSAIQIKSMSGNFAGKPIPAEVKKELPKIRPVITTYFDAKGNVVKLFSPDTRLADHIATQAAAYEAWQNAKMMSRGADLAKFPMYGQNPVGDLVMGQPVTSTIDIPTEGNEKIDFAISYTPVAKRIVQGEECVVFLTNGSFAMDSSDFQKSMKMMPEQARNIKFNFDFMLDGEMCVGLKSGEVVKTDGTCYLFFRAGDAAFKANADLELKLNQFRVK